MNLKYGIVTEVDATKGLARVRFDDDEDMVSDWLPMMQAKTLVDKFMIFYDINEHVVCLMDENCEEGVIIGAIYSQNELPDGGAAKKIRVKLAGNLSVEYDRLDASLNIIGIGNIKITSAIQVELIAPIVRLTTPLVQYVGALVHV